jgi:hypothetical protein
MALLVSVPAVCFDLRLKTTSCPSGPFESENETGWDRDYGPTRPDCEILSAGLSPRDVPKLETSRSRPVCARPLSPHNTLMATRVYSNRS